MSGDNAQRPAETPAPQLATVAAYAKMRGCSRQAVEKAAAKGRISLIDSPKGRMVDVDAANRSWAEKTDPAQQHRGSMKDFAVTQPLARGSARRGASSSASEAAPPADSVPAGMTLLEENTRLARLKYQQMEMDLAERRGELVSRAAIESAWSEKLIAAAELFQGMADRLSAPLAAEKDAHACHRLIAAEVRAVMSVLSTSTEALNS